MRLMWYVTCGTIITVITTRIQPIIMETPILPMVQLVRRPIEKTDLDTLQEISTNKIAWVVQTIGVILAKVFQMEPMVNRHSSQTYVFLDLNINDLTQNTY